MPSTSWVGNSVIRHFQNAAHKPPPSLLDLLDPHASYPAPRDFEFGHAWKRTSARKGYRPRTDDVIGGPSLFPGDDFGDVGVPVHAYPRDGISRRYARTAVPPDADIARIVRHEKPHAPDNGMGEPLHPCTVLVEIVVAEHRRYRSERLKTVQYPGQADIAGMDDVIALGERHERSVRQPPVRIRDDADQYGVRLVDHAPSVRDSAAVCTPCEMPCEPIVTRQ